MPKCSSLGVRQVRYPTCQIYFNIDLQNLGIGYAVAEALAENGAYVILSSSNENRVKQAVSKLQKAYPSASSRISGEVCNMGDEKTIESNISNLFEKIGKLDHVIYTAGDALASMSLDDLSIANVTQAGMVRFFGPLFVGKYAPKYLKGGPQSSITLTTGAVSQRPIPNWTLVGSYATGLQGMTRGLALDLKPIRVNLVSPGAVDTELWANSGFSDEMKQNFLKETASKLPTGKVAGPEDIAESYLYLLRDHNVTGSMISTNGGALLV